MHRGAFKFVFRQQQGTMVANPRVNHPASCRACCPTSAATVLLCDDFEPQRFKQPAFAMRRPRTRLSAKDKEEFGERQREWPSPDPNTIAALVALLALLVLLPRRKWAMASAVPANP